MTRRPNFRRLLPLLILAQWFIATWGTGQLVWCHGADGHVALELAHGNRCPQDAPGRPHEEPSSAEATSFSVQSASHAQDDCRDIPASPTVHRRRSDPNPFQFVPPVGPAEFDRATRSLPSGISPACRCPNAFPPPVHDGLASLRTTVLLI